MSKILLSPYFLIGILWIATIYATYLDWRDNKKSKALLVMTGIMWILVVICTVILATTPGLQLESLPQQFNGQNNCLLLIIGCYGEKFHSRISLIRWKSLSSAVKTLHVVKSNRTVKR